MEPEEEPPPMEGGEMPSINFQQQKDNFSVMTSGYIKSDLFKTDRSAFGSIKFSVDFELAVKSYVNSFANVTHGSLKACYKKAGTFCYKHKVCYIIIVCVAINDKDPLPNLPSIEDTDNLIIKQPYGYIHYKTKPEGHSTYECKTDCIDWDEYAIGFHFPDLGSIRQSLNSFSILPECPDKSSNA